MKGQLGVLLAVVAVIAGVVVLVDRLAPSAALYDKLATWWPVGIITIGVGGLLRLLAERAIFRGPLIIIAIGVIALLFTLDPLPGPWRPYVLPVLLLSVGTAFLAGRAMAGRSARKARAVERMFLIGRSGTLNWPEGPFTIGMVTAVTSGCVIDLTKATPMPLIKGKANLEARLDITAIASGIDLRVPDGWRVELDEHTMLARRPKKPTMSDDETKPLLRVYGLFLMSAFDVHFVDPALGG
ncbi:LiaF transmembrane domain-containing protein [Nonomuraea solani]|uniref:LiaF transmembrane domain-containing protein n=1 Tax=Nonomuraea solani TaxID=1144553 RepID=UPI000CDF18AE|nr:hypothetical protein [Nonomuraea solani]